MRVSACPSQTRRHDSLLCDRAHLRAASLNAHVRQASAEVLDDRLGVLVVQRVQRRVDLVERCLERRHRVVLALALVLRKRAQDGSIERGCEFLAIFVLALV